MTDEQEDPSPIPAVLFGLCVVAAVVGFAFYMGVLP